MSHDTLFWLAMLISNTVIETTNQNIIIAAANAPKTAVNAPLSLLPASLPGMAPVKLWLPVSAGDPPLWGVLNVLLPLPILVVVELAVMWKEFPASVVNPVLLTTFAALKLERAIPNLASVWTTEVWVSVLRRSWVYR
jgi:hypothetical protein